MTFARWHSNTNDTHKVEWKSFTTLRDGHTPLVSYTTLCTPAMQILDAVRHVILLQTAFCVAPYWPFGHRLTTYRWASVWSLGGAFALVLVAVYTFVRVHHISVQRWLQLRGISYLWAIIAAFECAFTYCAYPALVVHTFVHRRFYIEFVNGIADMDVRLERRLAIRCGAMNRRLQRQLLGMMCLMWPYFNLLWVFMALLMIGNRLSLGWGMALMVWTNQVEQFAMGLLTGALIVRMVVLRSRFRALRSRRLLAAVRRSARASDRPARETVAVWLTEFKRLVTMIDEMSAHMGAVMAMRFMHDFTLLLSQMYLVYWTLTNGSGSGDGQPPTMAGRIGTNEWLTVGFVAVWSVQNVIKIVATTYAAHVTVREVDELLCEMVWSISLGADDLYLLFSRVL